MFINFFRSYAVCDLQVMMHYCWRKNRLFYV